VPVLETTETDKTYKVTAEIPGIDPKDVEVTFEDGLLRIAGEKKEEREENERGFSLSERSYGAFERLIALPGAVNPDKINARFKNGVLTISIAKDGKKKTPVRRIDIKHSA
jgi:HSP20 family protein